MESAKTQKWSEATLEEGEFVPFFRSEAEEKAFASTVSPVKEADSFRGSDGVWASLLSDASLRAEFDRRVEEGISRRLSQDLVEEKAAFLEKARLEGLEIGKAQALVEISKLGQAVTDLCAGIVAEKATLLHAHEGLWVRLLRHLLQRFLVPNSVKVATEMEKWLSTSLAEFSKNGVIRISVSSSDYDRLEGLRVRSGEQNWNLAIDASLEPGQIHCECGDGGVFFSANDQISALDRWISERFPEFAVREGVR